MTVIIPRAAPQQPLGSQPRGEAATGLGRLGDFAAMVDAFGRDRDQRGDDGISSPQLAAAVPESTGIAQSVPPGQAHSDAQPGGSEPATVWPAELLSAIAALIGRPGPEGAGNSPAGLQVAAPGRASDRPSALHPRGAEQARHLPPGLAGNMLSEFELPPGSNPSHAAAANHFEGERASRSAINVKIEDGSVRIAGLARLSEDEEARLSGEVADLLAEHGLLSTGVWLNGRLLAPTEKGQG